MKDYTNFPPINYLYRVLKTCPKSAFIYIETWKKKGDRMNFSIDKKDIRKQFAITPTIFRNLLSPLMFLNIITFEETEDKFKILFFGPQETER